MLVARGRETHLDLLSCRLPFGQFGEFVEAEVTAVDGLGIGSESAAEHTAEHEDLADIVGIGRPVVRVAVMQGDDPQCLDIEAGFLADFLDGV